MTSVSPYRPDIDGLRAVAVLGVIWFHAGLPGLPGGFLGVDLFFAVSGYLITGIILRETAAGTFTLRAFWLRRVRRIMPALIVVSALTLPPALWLMLPDELENHGQALAATMLSANNVLLWLTSGYFGLDSQFKPLAHTWSLGVEEQYYLIVPMVLIAALRRGSARRAGQVLAGLSLASFAVMLWQRGADPDGAFTLLPARFWELGLGGLAAIHGAGWRRAVPSAAGQQVLAGTGLAGIAAAMALPGLASPIPGWPTLLPVGGALLVLVFADGSGAGRLLTLPPMRAIGLISYSAYLIHQPVFAFLRVVSLDPPAPWLMGAAILPVLLLAWLCWRLVEQPCRDAARWPARRLLVAVGGGALALTLAGLALHFTSGLRARWSELAEDGQWIGASGNAAYVQRPMAWLGKPFPSADRSRNVLVIGSSFARDFINMGLETGAFAGRALSYDTFAPCRGEEPPPALLARAAQAGAVVLGSGVTGEDPACIMALVRRFQAAGAAHVVVLGTKNFGFNNNAVMLLPAARRYRHRVKPLPDAAADNADARRALPPQVYVDLLGLMDDGSGTVPVFTPERKFISQDRKHLTRAGARWLGQIVFAQPQFAFLKQKAAP